MSAITTLEEQIRVGRAARKVGGWNKLVEKAAERKANKERPMTDKTLPIAMVVESAALAKDLERSVLAYSDANIRFVTPSMRIEGMQFSVIVIAHANYRRICGNQQQLEWFHGLQKRTVNRIVIEL